MALSTAADYINNRILRHARALLPGFTAGPELQADVLNEWQALIDEWNLDRNMPLTKPEYIYQISGPGFRNNNRDYTIGPSGADITGPRPVRLLKANLVISTVTPASRMPLAILPYRDYGDIPVLEIPPTGITEGVYYEPTFPNGILHFWPPINANSIEIWQNGALIAPATLDTVVAGTFPPGYENCIVYSVAERSQYLITKAMGLLNPKIAAWALKARQRIKNANASNPKAYCDFRGDGGGSPAYDPNLTYSGYPN